jgi:pimeloyl-ACP methyl ester carboxylesterase
MADLSLKLMDGTIVTGKSYTKLNRAVELSSASVPLIVLVHGGGCTSEFFDVNPKHTVRNFSEVLGIPAVAINRPGYGGTPALASAGGQNSDTFIQRHGRWLHELALPAIWKEFSAPLNASSIVMYGESIGGAICTVAAGLHAKEPSQYKLAGLVLSAMGSAPKTEPLKPLFEDDSMRGKELSLPPELLGGLAVGNDSNIADPSVWNGSRHHHPTSVEEIFDINMQWPTYWKSYANEVRVQVLYSMGEFDNLWHLSAKIMNNFSEAFTSSPWVESRLVKNAPHCIEFGYQCSGFLLRMFGFALECAASLAIDDAKGKK